MTSEQPFQLADAAPEKAAGAQDRGHHRPVSALRAWAEISARLRAARSLALFLDFDGTLVGLQRRPRDVRMPPEVRRLLARLARHNRVKVVIISGRRVRDLKRMIALSQLRYFGVHGAENERRALTISKGARAALRRAHRSISVEAAELTGVWIEPKGIAFAVHSRGAHRDVVERIQQVVTRYVDKKMLRILKGKGAWEILPHEIAGKWTAVQQVMDEMPGATMVYIGDDETDEAAFGAFPNGITVLVGNRPGTHARYFVPSPAAVIRLLTRLEKDIL